MPLNARSSEIHVVVKAVKRMLKTLPKMSFCVSLDHLLRHQYTKGNFEIKGSILTAIILPNLFVCLLHCVGSTVPENLLIFKILTGNQASTVTYLLLLEF